MSLAPTLRTIFASLALSPYPAHRCCAMRPSNYGIHLWHWLRPSSSLLRCGACSDGIQLCVVGYGTSCLQASQCSQLNRCCDRRSSSGGMQLCVVGYDTSYSQASRCLKLIAAALCGTAWWHSFVSLATTIQACSLLLIAAALCARQWFHSAVCRCLRHFILASLAVPLAKRLLRYAAQQWWHSCVSLATALHTCKPRGVITLSLLHYTAQQRWHAAVFRWLRHIMGVVSSVSATSGDLAMSFVSALHTCKPRGVLSPSLLHFAAQQRWHAAVCRWLRHFILYLQALRCLQLGVAALCGLAIVALTRVAGCDTSWQQT